MVERQTPPIAIRRANTQEAVNSQGEYPLTDRFILDCLKNGVHLSLDARTRNLIGIYQGTQSTLDELRPFAQVTTRERVQQIIIKGLTKMWQQLSPELQTQYPLKEIIALKRTFSAETRAKMSAAHKENWQDPDYRAKMSAALKGRTFSAETRAKMSAAHKGRTFSEETRAKMSAAHKENWQDRKRQTETTL